MCVNIILVITIVTSACSKTVISDVINQDCQTRNKLNEIKSYIKHTENATIKEEIEKDTNYESRGMKKQEDMFTKMLPFMVIPFLISSMMTPMALTSLKFMMIKAAFLGKMAIILFLVSAFWRFNNQGGVYSHNVNLNHNEKQLAMAHYGYNGNEEYGAYINR